MNTGRQETTKQFLQQEWQTLSEHEQQAVQHFLKGRHISRNTNVIFADKRTFGEQVADRVAGFGGSWSFIFLFCAVLVAWVILNSFILTHQGGAFDPYPYILLNLFLSMLAALQAPVILMSQNRQAAKDRLDATHDYEVNLKAELEVRALHEKVDGLREQQWLELIELQREQLRLLTQILKQRSVGD